MNELYHITGLVQKKLNYKTYLAPCALTFQVKNSGSLIKGIIFYKNYVL